MKKVLIVDNSSYMRKFIKKIIEKGGFNTTIEASSKEEAVEIFKAQSPEIVILDLNMSEFTMDGISVLNDIMKINTETAVIIISAVGHQSVKDECIALGAKSYVRKPFEAETLLKVLEECK
ncbi:two-component system, chemotaxis family, response regulator CheY [Clostridium cavendishii DSM 21758]|uniref:Stage 0 sporulation protein A homolog n=1 Tax=Clostridium cavendishii DSM 21758 TaxID=1121302 RepID=A0A1M6G8W0_9CLOT|nr:response regulator [Clostridium cavendishii]SHJ06348.1 two-component system, chemotaxis family, response regulator CheY [Clostridium cavendishii DSM 21758]